MKTSHKITENMISEVELSHEDMRELAVYSALDRIILRGMDESKVLNILRVSQESIKQFKGKWMILRAKELQEKLKLK